MPDKGNTDKKFRRHMRALSVDTTGLGAPAPNRARDAIPKSSKVVADQNPEPSASSGVASPLTEKDVTKRTYHPNRDIFSTDELLTIQVRPVKTIILSDSNAVPRDIEFVYGDPFTIGTLTP